jgi:ATP-dependent DNA helicase RecQ
MDEHAPPIPPALAQPRLTDLFPEPASPVSLAPPSMAQLRDRIRHTWGYPSLLSFQAEAMEAALAGRDALVVLATGGGKSLCYQAPALVRSGLTAVVSPLISLMKDQIDGLVASGVPAAMLNSSQDGHERRSVREALFDQRLKLVFVAPERLMLEGFLDELIAAGLSSIVIDEAHCISHWGHDFRPEYRQLGALRREHPQLPIQAYTATATPAVRADILEQLGLVDPLVLIGSCDRPNLTYRFLPRGELVSQVLGVVRRHESQAGIVYCLRRRDVEELSAQLERHGVRCAPYHAGLPAVVRKSHQERFLQEELDVIVATVAFGMGIDRADVRFVVHASLPKGIEQYSQESGRAGRDGLPAECVLLYSAGDYYAWKALLESSAPESGDFASAGDLEGAVQRLGQMLTFANGATCRHRFLLEHFGETGATSRSCGACDVCLGELAVVPDSQLLAQKILSCVVRCEQRYGGGHIADVLRGADTARIRQAGHDRLTTYGLLRELSVREIRYAIDQLVGLEHLRVTSGPYPTLFLSQSGAEVMRGARPVTLFALPKTKTASRQRPSLAALAAPEGAPAPDENVFERLRALRRRLASERGVPPYLIFNDRTLAELAGKQPRTPEEFRRIKGVGDKKAEDLGPAFLAEIALCGPPRDPPPAADPPASG